MCVIRHRQNPIESTCDFNVLPKGITSPLSLLTPIPYHQQHANYTMRSYETKAAITIFASDRTFLLVMDIRQNI
jgi:hypothetical protein